MSRYDAYACSGAHYSLGIFDEYAHNQRTFRVIRGARVMSLTLAAFVSAPRASDREVWVTGDLTGELVYEYTPRVTRVVEYGASADALFSGEATPGPEGSRVDFYLEGPVTGPKLKGTVVGVDYLYFRADGRAELHIHAEITTEDGKKISLAAGGVAVPERGSSVVQLRENVTLLTSEPEFAWVNGLQVWATGTVDVASGQIHVKAYAA